MANETPDGQKPETATAAEKVNPLAGDLRKAAKALPLNSIEIYKLYREKVTHEDTLINMRTTWFVALQAFLFTSFALSLDKVPTEVAKVTPIVFAMVGIFVCWTTFRSVRAAHDAINKTTSKWKNDDHVDGDGNGLGLAVKKIVDPRGLLPAIKGAGSDTGISERGSASSILLPWAVGAFWLVLMTFATVDYLKSEPIVAQTGTKESTDEMPISQ